MIWANVVNALLGIWFIIAPFVLGVSSSVGEVWTSVIGGIILLVLAGSAVSSDTARRQAWIQYVNGLVGVWFILAPWILSMATNAGVTWTSVIGGLIALVLSVWLLTGAMSRAPATTSSVR